MAQIGSDCCLTATAAVHLLAKLLDFQKNPHAELFIREFGCAEPQMLSLFQLESLLDHEACQNALMTILKVYVDRQSEQDTEEIVATFIQSPAKRRLVIDFCKPPKLNLKASVAVREKA